jgi:hypothetical protein
MLKTGKVFLTLLCVFTFIVTEATITYLLRSGGCSRGSPSWEPSLLVDQVLGPRDPKDMPVPS